MSADLDGKEIEEVYFDKDHMNGLSFLTKSAKIFGSGCVFDMEYILTYEMINYGDHGEGWIIQTHKSSGIEKSRYSTRYVTSIIWDNKNIDNNLNNCNTGELCEDQIK